LLEGRNRLLPLEDETTVALALSRIAADVAETKQLALNAAAA
jgi:hypothetical protein